MVGAYLSAAIVCAASAAVGQAVLIACGRRRWSWLAPAVGLAALLTAAALAAKLPGRATTAAVILVVLGLGAAAYLRGRGSGIPAAVGAGLPAALLAALAASLPFVLNARIGILGVGLVNDDMASHLLMADWAQHGTDPTPELVDGGYPLGAHSLAAALAEGLGTGLVEAFAGLTVAIAAIAALTAIRVLEDRPPVFRAVGGALAALPYLGAAYLAQGAFKEPLMALLLVAFALLLAETSARPRAAVPLGVLAAGAVFVYSFPGLFWLAGTAALWGALSIGRAEVYRRTGGRLPTAGGPVTAARPAICDCWPAIAIAGVTVAILTLPDWGRIADFAGFEAFDPAGDQTGLGNLLHPISPLEVLGVWPSGEFRISPEDSTVPAAVFYLGALLGGIALAIGLTRLWRQRSAELPAALGAAAVIYVGARLAGTPYTSAKALAIAAPVAILISLAGLLPPSANMTAALRLRSPSLAALGVAFVIAAAGSSFLALRASPVAPKAHAAELDRLRPLLGGEPVLFLGRDDFIAWELRGSPVSTHLKNFFNVEQVTARPDGDPAREKFDFDAVRPGILERFRFVLTTSSPSVGDPPAGLERVAVTRSYALWERRRPVGERRTLDEGTAPGARLRCPGGEGTGNADGVAAVWPRAPVEGEEEGWTPAEADPGAPARQTLTLGPGRWAISLQYDSPRRVDLSASGPDIRGGRVAVGSLPGNLDFRGPSPYFPAGGIAVEGRSPVTFEVSLAEAPLTARLLGGEGVAHLRSLVATPVGPGRIVPLARACGRYVDWYRGTLSARR